VDSEYGVRRQGGALKAATCCRTPRAAKGIFLN
jgi:hypothetical protein